MREAGISSSKLTAVLVPGMELRSLGINSTSTSLLLEPQVQFVNGTELPPKTYHDTL
jgi:hypothetical protein